MRSVLHIRLDAPQYSSDGIEKALRKHFEEYSYLRWQQIRFDENIIGLQDRIIAKSHMEEPDLVFIHIQSPGILDKETLRSMYDKSFKVLYTFDKREDIGWIKDLAPCLDLILLPDTDGVIEMKKDGFNNCEHLNSSADPDLYKKYPKKVQKWSTKDFDQDYPIPEIVFIGNNYANSSLGFPQAEQRVEMVEYMKWAFGDRFGVFGQGWKGSPGSVNTQGEINLYNGCKIAITHNNFNAGRYSSDRLWRSLACGTFTVSQYYYGINQDFHPGVIKTWLNFKMLAEECENYLKWDIARHGIAKAGRDWFMANHTWSHRIAVMKKLIEKHKLGKHELGQSAASN